MRFKFLYYSPKKDKKAPSFSTDLHQSIWGKFAIQLKLFLEKGNSGIVEDADGSKTDFFIVFLGMTDFADEDIYNSIKRISEHLNTKNEAFRFKPVIFIGLMNIMPSFSWEVKGKSFYSEKHAEIKEDAGQNEILEQLGNSANVLSEIIQPDKRHRVFDSNVWFHYVPLNDFFPDEIKKTIEEVKGNMEHGIYNSLSSLEYLEFYLRLVKNSHIETISKRITAHASDVVPFAFHSESEIRDSINNISLDDLADLQWRILFVDDHAGKGSLPSLIDDFDGVYPTVKKDVILEERLDSIRGFDHLKPFEVEKIVIESNSPNELIAELDANTRREGVMPGVLKLWVTEKLSTGMELITQGSTLRNLDQVKPGYDTHFDIILLDFLFQNEKQFRFGYHLIVQFEKWADLIDSKESLSIKRLLGPLGKVFFFPISVYVNAMQDKLQDLGISKNTSYWQILDGADPINTPGLFQFKLLSLMESQLSGVAHFMNRRPNAADTKDRLKFLMTDGKKIAEGLFNEEQLRKQVKSALMSRMTFVLMKIAGFGSAPGVQYNAIQQFPELVELGVQFRRFYSYKRKSSFARSVIERYFFAFDTYAWDHLQHFVYLLTYGGHQQKHEMWVEYNHIVKALDYQLREVFYDYGNEGEDLTSITRMQRRNRKIRLEVLELKAYLHRILVTFIQKI